MSMCVCLCVCVSVYLPLCVFVILADSSNLEIFLEMLNDGEIVIVVSHDEASTKYVMLLSLLSVEKLSEMTDDTVVQLLVVVSRD